MLCPSAKSFKYWSQSQACVTMENIPITCTPCASASSWQYHIFLRLISSLKSCFATGSALDIQLHLGCTFAASPQCCLSIVVKIVCRAFQCGFNLSRGFEIMCILPTSSATPFQQHLQIFGSTLIGYYICIKSGNRSSCSPIAHQSLSLSSSPVSYQPPQAQINRHL